MVSFRCLFGIVLAFSAAGQTVPSGTAILPLQEVRAGQVGVGRTVFQGDRVEEFRVEILGRLENVGPRQSLILARLSGGPLEHTGVMQGMSGSPVYVEGKLIGAVALAFPFSKDPIAGIRPIEEMLQPAPAGPARASLPAPGAPRPSASYGESALVEIATPAAFSGFTPATIEQFTPQLRALGLQPRQGTTASGRQPASSAAKPQLEPGSMITVQLVSGDLNVGADGTITHVEGKRVYAFGHPFLSVGPTEMPFARASVLTLLPNVSTSFKISGAGERLGVITEDRSAAVAGELGRTASLLPVSIEVHGASGPLAPYQMEMIHHRLLTPFLLQMATYSALDATQRTLGSGTFRLRARVEFESGVPPLVVDTAFAGDYNVPLQASLAAATPLATVLQGPFPSVRPSRVAIRIDADTVKRTLQIDQVYASRREVRPGEEVEVTTVLAGDDGREQARTVRYRVPVGLSIGPLNITVSDAFAANTAEFAQIAGIAARTPAQLVQQANQQRGNQRAYARFWRATPGYQVPGTTLADPPASLALVLGRNQAGFGNTAARNTRLAEIPIDFGSVVVSGARTIQVEVKE